MRNPGARVGFLDGDAWMTIKDVIQLRRTASSLRDREATGDAAFVFGFLRDTTTAANLPTAVLGQEDRDLGSFQPQALGKPRLFFIRARSAMMSPSSRSPDIGQGAGSGRNPPRVRTCGAAGRR